MEAGMRENIMRGIQKRKKGGKKQGRQKRKENKWMDVEKEGWRGAALRKEADEKGG